MLALPSVSRMTQTSTSGGSSDTDEKAFAVMPYRWSWPRVVITVTPVANDPTVLRNSMLVNACDSASGAARSVSALAVTTRPPPSSARG